MASCQGAPPGEVAMHDAKKQLREAEKLIEQEKSGEVEAKIAQATELMNRAPNDPRVHWARVTAAQAIKVLKGQGRAGAEGGQAAQLVQVGERSGSAAQAGWQGAGRCHHRLRRGVWDAEGAGVDLSMPFELTTGKTRPLREDPQECEAAKSKAGEATAPSRPRPPASPTKARSPTRAKKPAEAATVVSRVRSGSKLKGRSQEGVQDHADAFPSSKAMPARRVRRRLPSGSTAARPSASRATSC